MEMNVGSGLVGALTGVSSLLLFILSIVGNWKMFTKAGQWGLASIIPFYSFYVHQKIVFGNGWRFLILLIPVVNGIYLFYTMYMYARVYGGSFLLGLAMIFLQPLASLYIGLSERFRYLGPISDF